MERAHPSDEFRGASEWRTVYSLEDFISTDPACEQLKRMVVACAATVSPVLVTGESGTGKELIAQSIHQLSHRRHRPFVRVNCAAIPQDLLEAELFGYEAGAFTGAGRRGGIGKLELSDGGTLLLDEIAELPLDLQPKLLRVLQEKEIVRVGARCPRRVDFRLVTSTNRALPPLIRQGRFREDLYYRFCVLRLWIPPLRARPSDITLLAERFLRRGSEEAGRMPLRLTRAAVEMLERSRWPGNVRELHNLMTRLAVFGEGPTIDAEEVLYWAEEDESERREPLVALTQLPGPPADTEPRLAVSDLRTVRRQSEMAAVEHAIRAAGGNKTQAARLLGIPRSTLYQLLKVLGADWIDREQRLLSTAASPPAAVVTLDGAPPLVVGAALVGRSRWGGRDGGDSARPWSGSRRQP